MLKLFKITLTLSVSITFLGTLFISDLPTPAKIISLFLWAFVMVILLNNSSIKLDYLSLFARSIVYFPIVFVFDLIGCNFSRRKWSNSAGAVIFSEWRKKIKNSTPLMLAVVLFNVWTFAVLFMQYILQ